MIWNRRMRTNKCLAIIGLLLFKNLTDLSSSKPKSGQPVQASKAYKNRMVANLKTEPWFPTCEANIIALQKLPTPQTVFRYSLGLFRPAT